MEAIVLKPLLLLLIVISLLPCWSALPGRSTESNQLPGAKKPKESKQAWGYVNIRQDAFMFWWLYYYSGNGSYLDRPLVMWLQGGPGGSSTGFGNFAEIGPLDVTLSPRNSSWVKHANVLFIDNPVGSGFSYVTNTSALATNNSQIASDLIELLKVFLQKLPEFQKIPLYIFAESYGGKMAIEFSSALNKIISTGKLPCTFKGVALGDSWISPVDSVLTYSHYLYTLSLVDENGFNAINQSAWQTKEAIDLGNFVNATALFGTTQDIIENVTNGVNVYNILTSPDDSVGESVSLDERRLDVLYKRIVGPLHSMTLAELMNGPIREKLFVVPPNVTWGGQSQDVFDALTEDFMKPVTNIVEAILNTTNISVAVYTGQLDLIVDTPGTMAWVDRLKWAGIDRFRKAKRTPIILKNKKLVGYSKGFKNLSFYWILQSGHMVPSDAPEASVKLLKMVTGTGDNDAS